jgi:mRNA interferase RelE/StbE
VEIVYLKGARKALLKSSKRASLIQKIELLAADPKALQGNVASLKGRPESRLRVQDWRVIFLVEDGRLVIRDIAPRSSVYEVD